MFMSRGRQNSAPTLLPWFVVAVAFCHFCLILVEQRSQCRQGARIQGCARTAHRTKKKLLKRDPLTVGLRPVPAQATQVQLIGSSLATSWKGTWKTLFIRMPALRRGLTNHDWLADERALSLESEGLRNLPIPNAGGWSKLPLNASEVVRASGGSVRRKVLPLSHTQCELVPCTGDR